MMPLLLYFSLLVIWLLLLWPALRLRGRVRWWVVIAAAAGLLVALYEIWMIFVWMPSVTAPIRIDIPLLSIALWCVYAGAAAALFWAKWRRLAALLSIVLALIGTGIIYEWIAFDRESKRRMELIETRIVLLFEAKFRNRGTYESYFEMSGTAPASHPVGHWEAEAPNYYTRLIINPEGRVWLFHLCVESECHVGPRGSSLEATGDRSEQWTATLERRGGVQTVLLITKVAPDRLSLEVDGGAVPFIEVPPPIGAQPADEALAFLGSFTRVDCLTQHAKVKQIWLWREDSRLYAVGVFSTLPTGQWADFVSPMVMGEGARNGDGWSFEWTHNGRPWRASIALDGPGAVLTLEGEGQDAADELLEPGRIFRDGAIDLAPLTSKEDWDHWFSAVLYGHFSSGDIPTC